MKILADSIDREKWLEARRQGVGASESAILLLGRVFGKTRLTLWQEKLGLIEPPQMDEEMARMGNALEPMVARMFEDEHEGTILSVTPYGYCVRSGRFDHVLCTPDFQVDYFPLEGEDVSVFLETKALGNLSAWDEGIVERYAIQCQHTMYVMETDHHYIACFAGGYGGQKFRWKRIERDDDFIEGKLLPAIHIFWAFVTSQEAPPAGPYPEDARALGQIAGEDAEKVIQLDGQFVDIDAGIVRMKRMRAAGNRVIAHSENLIREAMGDATQAILPNGVEYFWKSNVKGARTLRRREPRGS